MFNTNCINIYGHNKFGGHFPECPPVAMGMVSRKAKKFQGLLTLKGKVYMTKSFIFQIFTA